MFRRVRGCLYLIPPQELVQDALKNVEPKVPAEWITKRVARDGDEYHMTVVSSQWYRGEMGVPMDSEFYWAV